MSCCAIRLIVNNNPNRTALTPILHRGDDIDSKLPCFFGRSIGILDDGEHIALGVAKVKVDSSELRISVAANNSNATNGLNRVLCHQNRSRNIFISEVGNLEELGNLSSIGVIEVEQTTNEVEHGSFFVKEV